MAGSHARVVRVVLVGLLGLASLFAACRTPSTLRRVLQPPSPHERYAASLREAGLADTGLGKAWVAAGERALSTPVRVALPFREAGYFPADESTAVSYEFTLRRGQQLRVECEVQASEALLLFLDLFEREQAPRRVASAAPNETRLQFEAERDGTYILRLQPELLRGGRFVLTQRLAASLAFPVPAAAGRVWSIFGDPRDAGRRHHEGIDIFAPRGTPATAAAAGLVRHVGTDHRGGNVVWLWDSSRGLSLYYAHLDRATVTPGQRVEAGETIGLIGNTGNARGTSPHLHFGIYTFGAGALDPLPFVVAPPGSLPAVPADLSSLGQLRRASREGARIRQVRAGEEVTARLPRHTVFRVEGAADARLRVRLPDGTPGFIARGDTEPLRAPVRRLTPQDSVPLLARPAAGSVVVMALPSGEAVPVLGEFDGFLLVQPRHGRQGWVAQP